MEEGADERERRRRRQREYSRRHYQRNRAKIIARSSAWRKANPHRVRTRGKEITPEQYQALVDAHDGHCDICGTDQPGGSHNTFHLDHNHATGKVRGLLCNNCNRGIGLLKDDPERLVAAANYLKRTGS